jgi:hypothetical protein
MGVRRATSAQAQSAPLSTEARHVAGSQLLRPHALQTTLIRYWEPFDNGDAVVSLLHHGSISSRSFMAAHHWYALKKFDTATSELVYAGVCSAHGTLNLWFDGREEAFGEYFSTHLVLTPEGKLDTTASVMVPVASPAVSEHRKGLRAVVRKELAVIKDIMLMQFGRLSERDNLSYSLGRPFSVPSLKR